MPLIIVRDDICKMNVDAIVNAANKSLQGGGGVDGAIHKAAGPMLLAECIGLNGCETGKAKISKGYQLPCQYVIHTVGPIWVGGEKNEEALLKSCYRSALELALQYNLESIAFPLISSGAYQFPKDKAFAIATETIERFVLEHDMTVYLVVFDKDSFHISQKRFHDITQYIDENYVTKTTVQYSRTALLDEADFCQEEMVTLSEERICHAPQQMRSLNAILTDIDDTFSQRLLKLIDIRHKTDVEVYKKANIDRKLFSKIKNNPNYKPSKSTVLSFCLALELSLDETKDLLLSAGFALSHSSKFDLIVEYFISNEIYDIFEVNETLFAFEQNVLGA